MLKSALKKNIRKKILVRITFGIMIMNNLRIWDNEEGWKTHSLKYSVKKNDM